MLDDNHNIVYGLPSLLSLQGGPASLNPDLASPGLHYFQMHIT